MKSIYDWIDRISVVQKNGMPICPYAKKALDDNKIKIQWLDETFSIKRILNAEIENYTYHWPKNTEIVVLVFDANRLNPHEIRKIILRNKTLLSERDFIALEDHPSDPGYIDNVYTGNGEFGIVLIQKRSDLNKRRLELKKTSYYENWDTSYYNKIIGSEI